MDLKRIEIFLHTFFEEVCFICIKYIKWKLCLHAEEWFQQGMITSDSDGNATVTKGLYFQKKVKL